MVFVTLVTQERSLNNRALKLKLLQHRIIERISNKDFHDQLAYIVQLKLFERPLAPLASEIVQGAPELHHLVDHSRVTVAKLISQNSQSLHRRQRVLDRNPIGRQQSVELATSPMQRAPLAPLPGSDHAGGSNLQPLKAAVTQKMNILGQSQSGSLSNSPVRADEQQ